MALLAGPLQAQDSDPIEYAENDTGPVATFTATDPEGRPVYWSLADAEVTDEATAADVADHAEFMISSDGVLSFKFSPDYEMPRGAAIVEGNTNTYKVVVVASDDAVGVTGREMSYEKVTVMVTDVDEPGMITLSAQQPQVSIGLTAELADDDATTEQVTAAKWKWEHSSTAAGPWTVILTATASEYPPLGVEDKYLRVTATYTDEHGSGKTAQAVSANMVRAAPAANNANPVFPSDAGARSVDENSSPGANVGKPVVANDAPGDVLTYMLVVGDDASSFDIDPATGQIMVGARATLDTEAKASYMVMVMATDPAGGAATPPQQVAITIKNVNEAPMMTGGATRVSRMEGGGLEVETTPDVETTPYTATDPESTESNSDACNMASCTWSVSGTDAEDFEIRNVNDTTFGALTFKKAPNYEMPADANRDNVYNVTVVATDKGVPTGGVFDEKNKMTATRDVVITVTNEEEAGTVTLSTLQPKVGVMLTASVTDLDNVVASSVTWKWERDDDKINDAENTGVEAVIEGAKSATYTPTAKDDVGENGESIFYLRAIASYTDGKGKHTAMTTSANMVEARTDNAPKFATETAKRSIGEDLKGDDGDDTLLVGDPVAAMDDDEGQLTYSLSGAGAANFEILSEDAVGTSPAEDEGQIKVKSGVKLDYETTKSYVVTVTATDPGNLSDSIDVTITVSNVDEAPKIAGDDLTKDYPENGRAQVARFTATDPEGRPVYWSLADAEDAEVTDEATAADIADAEHFMINSSGVLSFKFSPDYETPMGEGIDNTNTNTYKVVVVASDDAPGAGGKMSYRKVTVMVTSVEETETVTLSVQQAQVNVSLMATYNDLDNERPDSPALTWKWYLSGSQIPDAGANDVGLMSTYTPVSAGSLRVEASYTKTDGTKKAVSKTVSVRVAPTAGTNVPPNFVEGAGARSVDENSPPGTRVGMPVAAIDPGDVLTYALLVGDDASSFDINPANGQITVGARATLDADATAGYTVTVTATDSSGVAATPPQQVAITIKNVNEAPMMTGGATRVSRMEGGGLEVETTPDVETTPYTATDPESTESNSDACNMASCTWSVSGTDAEDFEIRNVNDTTFGALTFKKAPNYEMPADANRDNVYNVTVVATDKGVPTGGVFDEKNKMTATRDVVITVTNEEEAGTVTLSALQPKVGVMLTASVTDLDNVVASSVTWKWERDDDKINDAENTGVEAVIEGAKSATYTPTAKDDVGENGESTFYLRAIASYTDGKGKHMAEATSVSTVEMRTDNAPKFATETAERSIREDLMMVLENGDLDPTVLVGDPVAATDADDAPDAQVLTYSLSGADAANFEILSEEDDGDGVGQIRVKSGVKLDYEATKSYEVTVTATDSDGLSASIDVTITVTDVDEAPKIIVGGLAITGPASANYAENGTGPVATYTLAGPVSDSGRWTLSGDDVGDFRINRDGVLTFRSSPDYENPADADMDNVYLVTLNARDSEPNIATRDVVVTVTDVDDMVTGDALVDKYDTNNNDMIDKDEMFKAINDRLFGEGTDAISKEDMIDVINLYLFGSS